MIKIKVLGSASGVPTKKRFCESVVISVKNGLYLLDCGEPCSSLLVRKGIPYNEIKAVFISHMDPDHSSGIFMLIQLLQLRGRKLPLKLFVPEEANAKMAWKKKPNGYTMEAAIPFNEILLKEAKKEGHRIAFDIAVNDFDEKGKCKCQMTWNKVRGAHNDAVAIGELVFVKGE